MQRDLRRSPIPNYFSIDGILASDQKISCHTEKIIPKFGFLAPEFASSDGQLPAGISVDLPVWAAEKLWHPKSPARNYISVDMPYIYKAGVWEVADIDPVLTDLKGFHPHFFDSGLLLILTFCRVFDIDDNFPERFAEALKERVVCIGDTILPVPPGTEPFRCSSTGIPITGPIQEDYLDALEHKLFKDSTDVLATFENWRMKLFTQGEPEKDMELGSDVQMFHSDQNQSSEPA